MSTESMAPSSSEPSDTDRTPNSVLNTLIGGVVGVVLSFIPFSTVLGGAGPGGGAGFAIWGLVLLIALVTAIYTIGLSAVGGVLGTYLKGNR